MDIRIADLTEPGFFNGTIHCRVIDKRPMRTFDQGQVISVDLKDKSGEIRAVAFHDEATRMERLLRLDRVYRIKTFKLQTKRHQYSQSPHDLEIVFEARSVVTHMPDVVSFPRKKYHFVPLRSVLGCELGSFVDVIGVVVDTGELKECTHEDGKTSDMRYVTLADQSDLKIKARLWGGLARDFDGSDHPVLAFGNVTIMISSPDPNTPGLSRFLDAKVQTSILKNPDDFPETSILRKWFSANKDDLPTEDSRMDDSNIPSSSSGVEDIRRSIKDALKNRSVKVEVVKLVFLGPPEVGKTQLKRALLGDFREVQESTNVSTQAAPAVEVLLTGTANKKWELLDFSHLNKLSMDKNSCSDKQWSSSADTNGQRPVTRRSTSVDSQVTSSSQSPMRSTKPSVAVKEDTFESRSKHFENINSYILTSITKAEAKRGSKEPLEFKLMYIIDNGGQPSFLDFHSATATFAASYVLLFDARGKGLDAFPQMTLRKTEFPIRNMPPSIYSNFDLLRRSLMTVHHFSRRFNQKHKMITSLMKNAFLPAKSPHVLIVGTHKDISLEPKRFADKARLDSTCESIPSLKHQYDIRFVDSTNEQCEEELSDIRKTLFLKDNVCKFDLPLSWFQVYLLSVNVGSDENLQAQKYDDLYKMCLEQNHVKSPEEFRAMTTVLHSLGVFYIAELEQPSLFKGDFNDVLIFVDPNLLFDYLSRILAIPFREPSSISCRVLRELQNLGELTPDCLVEMDIPDTLGTLPGFHNKLLGWLVNWRLAANLQKDGEERLFIPSVLPPRPKASPPFIPSGRFKNVFPLYFTFQPEDTTSNRSFHYLPAGFFPHLVVHLMQSGRFFLRENSTNNQTEYPYRCRDSIVLSEGGGLQKSTLYICLVDESDRLAVYMWPAYQPRSSQTDQSPPASPDLLLCHAGEVLAGLKSCMIQTNESLFYTPIDNCVIALCSACPCEPSPPQTNSQTVQPALIHLAEVCFVCSETCLQCLSHSGFGAPIFDIHDGILAKVLRGFSGQTQDFAITRKRGVGERSQSEPSPSKTNKVPQTRRNATDPSQAERLHGLECAQDAVPPGPTAPRTGMNEEIGCSLDILEVTEYKDGLISEMKSLGAVLGIGADTKTIVSRHGSRNDHLLEILDLYITKKTPTWQDFCTALKRLDCFNNVRVKIEADHSR